MNWSVPRPPSILSRLLDGSLWVMLSTLFLVGFTYQVMVWSFPYQATPAEGGMIQSTRAVIAGLDPWSAPHAVAYSNTYGIGFPWAGAQARRVLPTMDLLHLMRLVSGAALFFGLGLLYWAQRDQGVERLVALSACAGLYAAWLYYDLQTARPDSLAIALYLLGVMLTLLQGRRWALLAGATVVLAFLVKPYGLLGGPLILLSYFMQGRPRQGSWALLGGLALGMLMGALVLRSHPLYLLGTCMHQFNATVYQPDWLLEQLRDLASLHWPLLLALVGAPLWARSQGRAWMPQGHAALWGGLSLLTFGALVAGPGGHPGAYLWYFNQLWLPFVLLFAVQWMRQLKLGAGLVTACLLLDALLGLRFDVRSYPAVLPGQAGDWPKAEAWVAAHPDGIYPPILTETVVKHHARLTDTEHSRGLLYAYVGRRPSALREAFLETNRQVWVDLESRRASTFVCGGNWPCPPDLARMGYRALAPFQLRSPQWAGPLQLSVYVPSEKK